MRPRAAGATTSPTLNTNATEKKRARTVPTHIQVLSLWIAAPRARRQATVGRIPAGLMSPDAKKRVAPTTQAEAAAAIAMAALSSVVRVLSNRQQA